MRNVIRNTVFCLALCVAGIATANGQTADTGQPVVDRQAAIRTCMEQPDETRLQACLDQLPLTPREQRAQDLMDDPAMEPVLEDWQRGIDAAMAEQARRLAARGDVRSLLGAVMIFPADQSDSDDRPPMLGPEARGWFQRALQIGAGDPLLAWVQLFDCHVLGCQREVTINRLLQVDADNAAARLWAIDGALRAGDQRRARGQLGLAARAGRFDPYTSQVLRLRLESQSGAILPVLDPRVATVMTALPEQASAADAVAMRAIAQWAAIGIAPLQGLTRLCAPDAPGIARDPAFRSDCVALLSMMANDDALMVHAQLAAGLLVRLDPGHAAQQWQPRLRQLAWWQEQAVPLVVEAETTQRAGTDFTEYTGWIANNGELGALRKLLQRHGIALAPPPGWEPPHASWQR